MKTRDRGQTANSEQRAGSTSFGGVVRKKSARDPVSEHDLMMMMELLRGSDPRGSIGEVRYGELGVGCTADYGSASGCARLQEETRSKKAQWVFVGRSDFTNGTN